MYLNGLEINLHEGSTLVDDVIDEMLTLRARFMTLKPDVHPDEDRALVCKWMRAPGSTVAIARDRTGALQVFVDMNARRITHGGKTHLVCYGNFVFASPAYRNHPAYALGNFWNLASQIRRHRDTPTMLIGAVYPTSFNAGVRTFPQLWALGEPDTPPVLAALAQQIARVIFGDSWDPNAQLVRTRTLPPAMSTASDESRASLARYEARNPNWRGLRGLEPAHLGPGARILRCLPGRLTATPSKHTYATLTSLSSPLALSEISLTPIATAFRDPSRRFRSPPVDRCISH